MIGITTSDILKPAWTLPEDGRICTWPGSDQPNDGCGRSFPNVSLVVDGNAQTVEVTAESVCPEFTSTPLDEIQDTWKIEIMPELALLRESLCLTP